MTPGSEATRTARAAWGLNTDPPAALFDGEDVDNGESAPDGLDLTQPEVDAIQAEAGRRGTEASTDEAN